MAAQGRNEGDRSGAMRRRKSAEGRSANADVNGSVGAKSAFAHFFKQIFSCKCGMVS